MGASPDMVQQAIAAAMAQQGVGLGGDGAVPAAAPADAGPQLGQAMAPYDHGVVPGPPASQEEFLARKQGFLDYLNHPQVQAALLQFGMAMGMPRSALESPLGQTMRAIGEGAEAAGRAQTNIQKEQHDAEQLALKQGELAVSQQQANTQSAAQVETARHNPAEEAIQRSEAGTQAARAVIEQQNADTEAKKAQQDYDIAKANVAVAQQTGASEAKLRTAQEQLMAAQGKYYKAHAQSVVNGTGQAATIHLIAQAIKAKNPTISDADALMQAASQIKSNPNNYSQLYIKALTARTNSAMPPKPGEEAQQAEEIRQLAAQDAAAAYAAQMKATGNGTGAQTASPPAAGGKGAGASAAGGNQPPAEVATKAAKVGLSNYVGTITKAGKTFYKYQDANGQAQYFPAQ